MFDFSIRPIVEISARSSPKDFSVPAEFHTAFISSSHRDLMEHRKKVIQALIKAEVFPFAMEFFCGDDAPPIEHCLKVLDKADACFIVVGNSYGSRPPRHQKSYTWLEYQHARKKMPIRVFLIADSNRLESDGGEDGEQLERFKHELSKRHTVVYFESPDDLATKVVLALKDLWVESESERRTSAEHDAVVPSLEASFSRATASLSAWPQTLVNDEWIERPELSQIESRLRSHETSVNVLLGPPGSGKSSLLARLCKRTAEAGMSVLGFKADELRLDVDDAEGVAAWLGMETSVDKAVTLLASTKPVLLVIDQLDALADLMDLHSGRLNAILLLMSACSGIPRVHIVCSCRELEFRRDARFSNLVAEQFLLQLPPWNRINQTLVENGIVGAEKWPEKFRVILQTPQHLDLFLRRHQDTGSTDVFNSYQAMLDDVWERKINTSEKRELVYDFTRYSMTNETQWAPLVKYEAHNDVINGLVADGIFDARGGRIGFRHQTMLEHARARLFTKTGESLLHHVLPRQDGLFVRPTVWSTLTYLREVDLQSYQKSISEMLAAELRLHLRHLLIDFLGMQTAPHEFEIVLMAARLKSLEDRKRVLIAIRGREAWFNAFHKLHFPAIARWPTEDLWPLIVVIEDAWTFAAQQCFDFIDRYLLPHPDKDELTWRCMRELAEWDLKSVERVQTLIRRAKPGRLWWGEDIAYLISAQTPELAPLVVSTLLRRSLDNRKSSAYTSVDQSATRNRSPLECSNEWYELPSVAEAAPITFLRELWPWFVDVAEIWHHGSVSSVLNDYGKTSFNFDRTSQSHFHYPVLDAIEVAVLACSRTAPDEFLQITRSTWEIENGLVQVMLVRGLTEAAASIPGVALDFLSSDARRLSLGCYTRGYEYFSYELINAVSPHLNAHQLQQLESLIRQWSQYRPDAELCDSQVEWDREARLRLLMAIPADRQSPDLAAFIVRELDELPNALRKPARFQGGFVESIAPMSKDEMRTADDEAIVEAIMTPGEDDPRKWIDSPDGRKRPGGGDAACQQLCQLAKEDSNRGASLVAMLLARGIEDAAGNVLNALAESNLPDDAAFSLLAKEDFNQIRSETYRRNASYFLYKRCRGGIGLPLHLCELLEHWLLQPWTRSDDSLEDKEHDAEKDPESVLWRNRGGLIDSDHSFFVFEALACGLLMRNPPECATWLSVLQQHLQHHPSPRAWRSYCTELRWLILNNCARDGSTSLIKSIFEQLPEVRDSIDGIQLIGNISYILPPELVREILGQINDSDWSLASQAVGELLTLIALRDPEHAWARNRLGADLDSLNFDDDSNADAFAAGVAFAAARLWDEPECRADSCQLLLRLIPVATPRISAAISTVFWASEDFPADEVTEGLIAALADHPDVIVGRAVSDLIPHLVTLVSYHRASVLRVCRAILTSRGHDVGNMSSELYASGGHLVSIAMTVQRYPETRSEGLDLFEELLRLGVGDAFECLNEIDLRPIGITHREPRPRRRRRRV